MYAAGPISASRLTSYFNSGVLQMRCMANVIIVSNRLPVSVKKVNGKLEVYPSSGGLATGLSSYTKRGKSLWIGWPGIVTEELSKADRETIATELAKHNCYPVFLTRKQLEGFYNGYSNSILWPFLHNLPPDFSNEAKLWRTYKEVNSIFADVVLSHTQPKSVVWVHDYQLLLLPELLRREQPRSDIGFFLHIPFPDAAAFASLNRGPQLLRGMLGADLIGFHTTAYAENFLDSCHKLDAGLPSEEHVILPDRVVRVTDFPMGIDYTKFSTSAKTTAVQEHVKRLQQRYQGYKIILTVDRLDPTKGLAERLEAYRAFLEQNPKLHGKVKMVMLAVPSRTEIDVYRELKERVETLVTEINDTFGTESWEPVHYMFKSVPFEELSALYQIADVAFITPIRDGMNLVAKEYVASQQGKHGVLILSETAGAAQELTDAIIVNPERPQTLVRGLTRAIAMPQRELRQRLTRMQRKLSTHTVHKWAGNFVQSLQQAGPPKLAYTRTLNPKLKQQLTDAYAQTAKRLLLLDYDGVLTGFSATPDKAKPSKKLKQLLGKLSSDPANQLVIISGRSRQNLENWLGNLPVTLAAEHGTAVKTPGEPWSQLIAVPRGWKQLLLPILQRYADKTPGAFVEEKDFSLVWHYRNASPYYAQKNIAILKRALGPTLRRYGLQVFSGHKILEFKSPAANKGTVVSKWLTDEPDFILAIGDDYTDEDMFLALPDNAYTIKVGRGRTEATFRLQSSDDVLNLLRQLA